MNRVSKQVHCIQNCFRFMNRPSVVPTSQPRSEKDVGLVAGKAKAAAIREDVELVGVALEVGHAPRDALLLATALMATALMATVLLERVPKGMLPQRGLRQIELLKTSLARPRRGNGRLATFLFAEQTLAFFL